MTTIDPWDYWRRTLAGVRLAVNDSAPQPGFYRWPTRPEYGARKVFTPVAYWPAGLMDKETGEIVEVVACRIGDEDVPPDRGVEIWRSVARYPVTEDAYRGVAERGELWPDEPTTVPMQPTQPAHPMMGHNKPPADVPTHEQLKEQIDVVAAEAKQFLEGPAITEQYQADLIANCADRLQELWKKADEQRSIERKPYDEEVKAIQQRWSPLLLAAEAYKNLKYKLITPWLLKLQKAAAEKAAETGREPERPKAGTRGRAMSLRPIKRAEITDYDACLNYFRNAPDIKATVQDLANKAVRAGVEVPGARLLEETKAV